MITFNNEEWSTSIESINRRTYDRVKLFRTTLHIDIGISPLSLIVAFDGTLILPMRQTIPKKRALSLFNKHLTQLLLGGLLVEEMAPDDISPGQLNFWGYHRHLGSKSGRYTRLSQALRMGWADPNESILLLKPKTVTQQLYTDYHSKGFALYSVLPENLSTVLLPSCTAYSHENWERALILCWTSIELIIEQIWKQDIIGAAEIPGIASSRRRKFLSDTRTWSTSTRIELLWREGHISDHVYAIIDKARAARNSFIHSASESSPEAAKSALEGLLQMIDLVAKTHSLSFDAPAVMKELDESTEHFRSPISDKDGRLLFQPQFWRPLDPAPGFKDWGDRPFERHPEIELKPIPRSEPPKEGH